MSLRSRVNLSFPEGTAPQWVWLTVCLGAVVSMWLVTFDTGLRLGDAPESIAGAEVFGVLHAPGYVIYSALGWLAIRLLPFLSSDVAVTLVSLLASLAAVALVFVASRFLGVSPPAAAVGGVLFGLSMSVWFYAGYAKHTAATTLLVAALITLTVWVDRTSGRRGGAGIGVLIGVSIGLGWPVAATVAPVSVWAVWRRLRVRGLAWLIASTVGAAAMISLVILWRGSVSPPVNWGAVDSGGRLWDLLSMKDFGLLSSTETAEVSKEVGGSDLVGLPGTLWSFVKIAARNIGIPAALLAVFGLFDRGWRRHWPIAMIAGVNLVAVSLILGVNDRGVESVLVMGGFVAPTLVAVAIMAATGADWLLRFRERAIIFGATVGLVGVIVLSAVVHRPEMPEPSQNLPLLYATDVLAEVPEGGAVVVWQAERSFPLTYAQVIHGQRPDVLVIAADGLATEWYREQLHERHLIEVAVDGDLRDTTADTVARLMARGTPVHLDLWAWEVFRSQIPSQVVGVTAEAFPESEEITAAAVDRILTLGGRRILEAELVRRWPNETVMTAYARSAIIAAQQSLNVGDTKSTRQLLEVALTLDPGNETVAAVLETLDDR